MKLIKLALAVDNQNKFDKIHFGDADKYLIYEYDLDNNSINFILELKNELKTLYKEHGSQKKGDEIIEKLKSINVSVLVSMQFGKNIKKINKYFIPVIVYKNSVDESLNILKKHFKWIEDEIDLNPSEYKVFKLNNGVLKYSVK